MYTAFFLQKAIEEELKKLFKNDRFPNKDGEMVELNIFEQFLPVYKVSEKEEVPENDLGEFDYGLMDSVDEDVPAPYVIVILSDGEVSTVNQPGFANIILYICMFDDGMQRAGYQYVVHVIQRVIERFQKDFTLSDGYRCGEKISFSVEIADVESHPYYFGIMEMDFRIKEIEKEDKYC